MRDELLDRRQRLESALRNIPNPDPLRALLRDVDSALERIENGTFGMCVVCHEPIEAERLAADPLLRNCLDHLTREEQRALERDLDLSSRVQSELLPARQLVHGEWELAYHLESFGPVSGDYCDVQTTPDGQLHVFFGDVAGKGVAASLLMAHLHAMFRSLIGMGLSLAEMVARANRIFCESTGGNRYATLVCGRTAPDGRIETVNAGHVPALHITAQRSISVPADGLPLGLFCGSPYATNTLQMAPGDTLLLYTDGVSEARNRANEEFGGERLARSASARREAPVFDMVQGCLDDLAAFRAGVPRHDDITLLALRRSG
jgi:sigma-B regulation protein RsbU (phosphoserine phosphatase)